MAIVKIGEKINADATIKIKYTTFEVRKLLEKRSKQKLQWLAKAQIKAGADALDVNVGIGRPEGEPKLMAWLVDILQKAIDRPLCLDTDNPQVLEVGLERCQNRALVNSISGERKRLDSFLPLIEKYNASCIALAVGGKKIPSWYFERVEICKRISEEAEQYGVEKERIFFDPVLTSVGADINGPSVALDTLKSIKIDIPGARTVLAISNVSYGLPKRKLLNQVFLNMCLPWIDAVILDPLDKDLMDLLKTGKISFDEEDIEVARKALRGEDDNCDEYIARFSEAIDLEEIF